MQVVILAGGLGSRISEESLLMPKPLISIGSKPIIWHIMKIYSNYGFNDFIICCGYKGYLIKEYFANYYLHTTDIKVDLHKNSIETLKKKTENWNVTLVDTGEFSNTGERIKRIEKYIKNDNFCLTYGDGLSSVNIKKQVKVHKANKKLATVLAVSPSARFGALKIKNNHVQSFLEKPKGDNRLVNGGFFVLNKKIFKYLNKKNLVWEKEPLKKLSKEKQLYAMKHKGFWYAMDTIRDKEYLESLWLSGKCPWKTWDE
tara:strand:- start:82 stop:855 length:774 start_codon:yes stop_codon:yes gene_type:complete